MKISIKRLPIEQVLWLLALGQSVACQTEPEEQSNSRKEAKRSSLVGVEKDFRWPQRQLNVLVDRKSINETERQILGAFFDQIQHKTCLKINQLSPLAVNPFDPRQFQDSDRNFIYIFKAQLGLANTDHPPLGLSTFGCLGQGRQSMVLGDLAFRWPELVLKYHLLRSLALPNLTKPEEEVRRRLNVLPVSQRIGADEAKLIDPAPLFTYATFAGLADKNLQVNKKLHQAETLSSAAEQPLAIVPVEYLNEQELMAIKDLYNCSDYSNRLSTKPLDEIGMKQSKQLVDLYSSEVSSGSSSPTESSVMTTTLNSSSNETTTAGGADQKLNDIIDQKINDTLVDDAAKSIMNQLISDNETSEDSGNDEPTTTTSSPFPEQAPGSHCKPLESCTLDGYQQDSDGQTLAPVTSESSGGQKNKPMMLQLDDFHAQDPHFQQADQMKLSQLNNNSSPGPQTYRLMDADLTPQQQSIQLPSSEPSKGKSEMLISFEQSGQQQPTRDPIGALASSQVLKLCSCTCQTMAPVNPPPNQPPQPLPSSTQAPVVVTTSGGQEPFEPTFPADSFSTTERPTSERSTTERSTTERSATEKSKTDKTTTEKTTTLWPPITEPSEDQSSDSSTERLATTTFMPTKRPKTTTESFTFPPFTTTTSSLTSEVPTFGPWTTDIVTTEKISTTTNGSKSSTTDEMVTQPWTPSPFTDADAITEPPHTAPTVSTTSQGGSMADNPCDQVQWVKPNKTVYASARIVWDVDRANQNYFLCQNQIKDEQVPGKTHGFSCKVGNEGHAYELHNFNVLTKPENVNLAWIQRNSGTLGKKNLPVIGGYSKNQDPLVVSRCMVRDENNDVITLIGYINSSGVGLFPFDDIQIECSQYDVLACVS